MFIVNFYRPQTLLRRMACRVGRLTFAHCNLEIDDDSDYLFEVQHGETGAYRASEVYARHQPDLRVWFRPEKIGRIEERLAAFRRLKFARWSTYAYCLGCRPYPPPNCASGTALILGYPFYANANIGTPDELLEEMIFDTYRQRGQLPPSRQEVARLVRKLGKQPLAEVPDAGNLSRIRIEAAGVLRGGGVGISAIAGRL